MNTSKKITIYPEEPCLLSVKYPENPLTAYGKTYDDIEQIIMCLKLTPYDSDEKYLFKYYKDENGDETGDVLIEETNHTFTLDKKETDSIPVSDQGYNIYIGVKVTGLTKYLWIRVNKSPKIIVEPDGINK